MAGEKTTKETEVFEKTPLPRAVAALAVPTIISQLATVAYNMVDTWFIGRTGDTNQVAAVTLAFPIMMILGAISNMFGIGGGSLISRLMGQKRYKDSGVVLTFLLWASTFTALVCSVLMAIFINPILTAVGADIHTLTYTKQFLFWTFIIGGVPTVLNMTMAYLIRGLGGAKTAGTGLIIGVVINIILDPIFIFSFDMKVAGAALATCISNIAAMLYLLQYLIRSRKSSIIPFEIKFRMPERDLVASIFTIGTPAALQIVLAAISNSVSVRLMSGYTSDAIAALGITQKIELLPYNIIFGIATGILPLLAYNYAAKNYERVHKTVRFSITAGFLISVVILIGYELFAPAIVSFFISDEATIRFGAAFARLRCIAFLFLTVEFILISVFQGIGGARQAMILSLFRKGIVDLPLMMVMNLVWPMYGLMLVQPAMEFLGAGIAVILYLRLHKKMKSMDLQVRTQ